MLEKSQMVSALHKISHHQHSRDEERHHGLGLIAFLSDSNDTQTGDRGAKAKDSLASSALKDFLAGAVAKLDPETSTAVYLFSLSPTPCDL